MRNLLLLLMMLAAGAPAPAEKANFQDSENQAWSVFANSGPQVATGLVVFMQDSNEEKPGSLWVVLQRSGEGRWVAVSVGAFGCREDWGEVFEGAEWESSSTKERSARAKASVLAYSKIAARTCHADISSLNDEMRSFDGAFRRFDEWGF